MLNHGNFNAGLMEGRKGKIYEICAALWAFKMFCRKRELQIFHLLAWFTLFSVNLQPL